MKRTLLSLALAAPLSAIAQHGVSLELGYVQPRYTPSPDNQWWQKDQDSSGRYKTNGMSVGLNFDLNPSWTASLRYVDLGRPRVDALAVTFPNDSRADLVPGTDTLRAECSTSYQSGCLYQWHTQSHIRGFEFDFAQKLFQIGTVRVDGKVGLLAYHMNQTAVWEPLGCRDNCPWRLTFNQSGNGLSPSWGAVVRWKYLYFMWDFKERIGEHMPVTANVKGRMEVKTFGLRIPLW